MNVPLSAILEDFGLLALFKDFLESRMSVEYVTAYITLKNIQQLSPRRRRRKTKKFCQQYVWPDSPRQLALDFQSVSEALESDPPPELVEHMLVEIEELLTGSWVELLTSEAYELYRKGKITSRMEVKENRRDSDDEAVAYYKKQGIRV
jgi:hypothetical protein